MSLKMLNLFLILTTFNLTITFTSAALFNITNNCPYTVWAAAMPGGGRELKQGQYWVINTDPNNNDGGRIWGRTNCDFSASAVSPRCESGDCDGVLYCESGGSPPVTLAEYQFNSNKTDFLDISLVDGFNVNMEFRPINSSGCTGGIKCTADINRICPTELRDPGGCNHPCTVFNNDQFCCLSGRKNCKTTPYTKLFEDGCPNAYTTPYDDATSLFTCPTGTDYEVLFCPNEPSRSATFEVRNNCPYTIWAAGVPGGGKRLNKNETWTFTANPGTKQTRIWARTNCQFDTAGKGKCETGDCNGLLECTGYGAAPNTMVEYAIDQFAGQDYIDISVVDGFNVPVEISAASGQCTRVIKCTADIIGQCPNELKVPGGCNGPCPVFKTEEYCCTSVKCGPTNLSKYFKERCPDAYSYPKDDPTGLLTCPTGTNYKIIFCP